MEARNAPAKTLPELPEQFGSQRPYSAVGFKHDAEERG
jgi:hypothetical protein